MARLDLIIRNGTLVTASDTVRCDVGIKDGRIAVLAQNLSDADEIVDARDKLVLDRIEVDVVDVPLEISLIPNRMLPKAPLPECVFTIAMALY